MGTERHAVESHGDDENIGQMAQLTSKSGAQSSTPRTHVKGKRNNSTKRVDLHMRITAIV